MKCDESNYWVSMATTGVCYLAVSQYLMGILFLLSRTSQPSERGFFNIENGAIMPMNSIPTGLFVSQWLARSLEY